MTRHFPILTMKNYRSITNGNYNRLCDSNYDIQRFDSKRKIVVESSLYPTMEVGFVRVFLGT